MLESPASPPPPAPRPGTAARAAVQFTPDADIHVLDRLAILYKYRRIVITVFTLVLAAMLMNTYTRVPMYRAQARLQIDDERSTAVPGINNENYWQDPEPYYNTQFKILQGRELATRVTNKLNLAAEPEFNGSGQPPSGVRGTLSSLKRRAVEAVWGPPPVVPRRDETRDESAYINAFLGRVEVVPVRGSRLVDLFFTSTHPDFAAKAVNTLAAEYVDQNLEVRLHATQNSLQWVAGELEKQRQRVTDSERALAEYRGRQDAISLGDRSNIVLSRLNQLNESLTKARTNRLQKEALYSQIKSLPPNLAGADSIAAVSGNITVQSLKSKLADLQRERARLSDRYGEKHPQVVAVNTQLEDAQRQLQAETVKAVQQIRNDYDSAVAEERSIAASLDEQKTAAMTLDRKSVDYSVLERSAQSDRQVYEQLLQREKELQVQSNSRANNVRLVDRAEVPKEPYAPSSQRTWLLALLVAVVTSTAVAFGLDYMNDTIKTPEDLTRRLKMPFLGLVPSVRGADNPVLSSQVPHDFGESFRALRTSLVSTYAAESTRIVLVTSAQPLEGKTTTAVNIAIALAYGGARVLLIDADMRRPGVQRTLKMGNEKGLSHLLVGQARFREVIQRTADPNLLVITAGRTPPNPSELLASERMKALVSNLASGPFDWVIIDTPPVLAVTDAVILAPWVTGAMFVVGAEMTRRRLAERAVETLLSGKPRIVGGVLNRVDFARNRYYYSRYYGYQHKSYYAEATV